MRTLNHFVLNISLIFFHLIINMLCKKHFSERSLAKHFGKFIIAPYLFLDCIRGNGFLPLLEFAFIQWSKFYPRIVTRKSESRNSSLIPTLIFLSCFFLFILTNVRYDALFWVAKSRGHWWNGFIKGCEWNIHDHFCLHFLQIIQKV